MGSEGSEKSDVGGGITLCGRVQHIRDLGGIRFLQLEVSEGVAQVVLRDRGNRVKRGSLVRIEATRAQAPPHENDLVARSVTLLSTPTDPVHLDALLTAFSSQRRRALEIRGTAVSCIHSIMMREGYTCVQSPTIVGPWVVGQTPAFPMQFYDRRCFLAISNMIYHQVLLTAGFHRIYELGKLFRAERPSSPKRLAEFTALDIGVGFADCCTVTRIVELIIRDLHCRLLEHDPGCSLPAPTFARVAYSEVLKNSGLERTSGAQLPRAARQWLQEAFESFVWVESFPERTRPFFVRSEQSVCFDVQLWFRGKQHVAAGGERETDPIRAEEKIRREGKDPANYLPYLRALHAGAPPMAGIGLGLERLLATWIPSFTVSDFAAFPRYEGHVEP